MAVGSTSSQRLLGTTNIAASGRTAHESKTHVALHEERQRHQGYRIAAHEPSSAGKSDVNYGSNSMTTAEPGHQLAADFASVGTQLQGLPSGRLNEDLRSARILDTAADLSHRRGPSNYPGQLAGQFLTARDYLKDQAGYLARTGADLHSARQQPISRPTDGQLSPPSALRGVRLGTSHIKMIDHHQFS